MSFFPRQVGESSGFTSIDLHPSNEMTHRFVLQGLEKFTSYQVVLQAYNKEGIGPASTASVATTMEDGKSFQYQRRASTYEVIGLNNGSPEVKANGAFIATTTTTPSEC